MLGRRRRISGELKFEIVLSVLILILVVSAIFYNIGKNHNLGYNVSASSLRVNAIYELAVQYQASDGRYFAVLIKQDGRHRLFSLSEVLPENSKHFKVVMSDGRAVLRPLLTQ